MPGHEMQTGIEQRNEDQRNESNGNQRIYMVSTIDARISARLP